MSKQVPIAISWFFNGNLIWHFSNEAKTEKMVTQNGLLLQKMQKYASKITQTLHFKSGNGPHGFYPWCMTILDCLCGTLVGKTELKCTKNFKALYLNFTKCNGTGFWRFVTDQFFVAVWEAEVATREKDWCSAGSFSQCTWSWGRAISDEWTNYYERTLAEKN